ncbi:signal peptidase II [Demequina sp. TTPB684]|uniref:signal peptidase II n=1 Tax=unclassified Demequina TaxID=2620311 RepID=UPI001CF2E102|nr:signal peptidase II [Demequina sp. TMPB413]MCB2412551.1 signal peptidase II [Demequina sp. TTPB684]UPU87809.1 signal peptidase II [Demequina sp. TMPB413]
MAAGAALVATVDLSAKAWAVTALQDRVVGLGLVDLRLAYNPGVAFSVGAGAPAPLVVTATAVVTAALGMFAWRAATGAPRGRLTGLALILGGATANVVDRARDGVVTDYLHTGWWPTFNLADAAIVTGAALLVLTRPRDGGPHGGGPPRVP